MKDLGGETFLVLVSQRHSRPLRDSFRCYLFIENWCASNTFVQKRRGQALFKPIPNVGHNLKIRSALFKLRLYPRMHKELWRDGNDDSDHDDNDDNDEDGNDDNDDND